MEPKKLTRSSNICICGVCSGLAEYFGMNVTLMRVLWAVLTICTWFWLGVIAYVVLAFVLPPASGAPVNAWHAVHGRNVSVVVACGLIFLGCWIIVQEVLKIDLNRYLFPIGLVAGGALLLAFALGRKSGN